MKRVILGCAWLFVAQTALAGELTLVAYNVESGGAKAATVAEAIKDVRGVDIWGFSELASYGWLETFEDAAEDAGGGADYEKIIGSTGEYEDPDREPDYLAFLYNTATVERLENRQLHAINDWKHRSPLAVHFRHKASGQEFVVVLNHLASGDQQLRMQQTWQLREWAFFRRTPVIMMGDFNYRWKIGESEVDPPRDYVALTSGDLLQWIKPSPMAHTWCGHDSRSVFDFFFVNEVASRWVAKAKVIETPCEKSDQTVSDHRPIWVRFDLP